MNTMPTVIHSPPDANQECALPKRRIDPILQEVYDLKARLNAEAEYSVERILERARLSPAQQTLTPGAAGSSVN